jgi:hypothetical protein
MASVSHSEEKATMRLKKSLIIASLGWAISLGLMINPMAGQDSMGQGQMPMVGGALMYPTKDIVENAMNSKDHTTRLQQ